MLERSVYLSSTYLDFKEVRAMFEDSITKDLAPWYKLSWIMEHMRSNGNNNSPVEECVRQVKKSDIYILFIGDRYGSETIYNKKFQSYTEHEFDAAIEAGVPSIFLIYSTDDFGQFKYSDLDNRENSAKLAAFKKKALEERVNARKIRSLNEAYADFSTCLFIDLHKRLIGERIDLKPMSRYTIDRGEQDDIYDRFNIELKERLVVPTFIFTRTADRPELYTKKIWFLKFEMANDYTKTRIRSDSIPVTDAKRLNHLIRKTTGYFLNGRNENISTFEELLKKPLLEGQKIIEFEIGVNDCSDEGATWINLVTDYLNQLQEKFTKHSDRIYALIHIFYDEEEISDAERKRIISLFKFKQFEGVHELEILDLQKLLKIDMDKLKNWVTENFQDSEKEKAIVLQQLNNYKPGIDYTYQQIIDEFKLKI